MFHAPVCRAGRRVGYHEDVGGKKDDQGNAPAMAMVAAGVDGTVRLGTVGP